MRRARFVLATLGGVGCVALLAAPHVRGGPRLAPNLAVAAAADPIAEARARLAEFEDEQRRAIDFLHLPPARRTHGVDPYALARLDARHLVGVLRGASALVLLDPALHELDRVALARGATAVSVSEWGECWVASDSSPVLHRLRVVRGKLRVVSEQGFGYIDSFAFAYRLSESGQLRELWRTNLSELGVVTPKAPILHVRRESARLFISGSGSDRAVELSFAARAAALPTIQSEPFFQGPTQGFGSTPLRSRLPIRCSTGGSCDPPRAPSPTGSNSSTTRTLRARAARSAWVRPC